ncbi:MAG: hypothetical protein QM756_30620 [Polyangiaceae bacterium]
MKIQLGLPAIVSAGPLPRRLAWLTGARLMFLLLALALVGTFYLRDEFDIGAYTLRVTLTMLAGSFGIAGLYAGRAAHRARPRAVRGRAAGGRSADLDGGRLSDGRRHQRCYFVSMV